MSDFLKALLLEKQRESLMSIELLKRSVSETESALDHAQEKLAKEQAYLAEINKALNDL